MLTLKRTSRRSLWSEIDNFFDVYKTNLSSIENYKKDKRNSLGIAGRGFFFRNSSPESIYKQKENITIRYINRPHVLKYSLITRIVH